MIIIKKVLPWSRNYSIKNRSLTPQSGEGHFAHLKVASAYLHPKPKLLRILSIITDNGVTETNEAQYSLKVERNTFHKRLVEGLADIESHNYIHFYQRYGTEHILVQLKRIETDQNSDALTNIAILEALNAFLIDCTYFLEQKQ